MFLLFVASVKDVASASTHEKLGGSGQYAPRSGTRETAGWPGHEVLGSDGAGSAACGTAVAEVPAKLAQGDHTHEDQPYDEHRDDDVSALLGRRLFGRERDDRREHGHAARILEHSLGVQAQSVGDGGGARLLAGEAGE